MNIYTGDGYMNTMPWFLGAGVVGQTCGLALDFPLVWRFWRHARNARTAAWNQVRGGVGLLLSCDWVRASPCQAKQSRHPGQQRRKVIHYESIYWRDLANQQRHTNEKTCNHLSKSLQARDIHIIFIKGIWGTIFSERQLKSSVRFCGLMAIIKKGAVGSSVG
jgi:hypothetical protein